MVKNDARTTMRTPAAAAPTLLLSAAAAAAFVLLLCSPSGAKALPYRDMGSRGSGGEVSPSSSSEGAGSDELDLWRALLLRGAGAGGAPGYLSEEEEALRHLALMERRRKVLEQQNLLAARQRQIPDFRAKRRGSCLFHAGLAQNCDFRDVVGAVNEASHWGSEIAPGKRRR